jgi:hypothetical protein
LGDRFELVRGVGDIRRRGLDLTHHLLQARPCATVAGDGGADLFAQTVGAGGGLANLITAKIWQSWCHQLDIDREVLIGHGLESVGQPFGVAVGE